MNKEKIIHHWHARVEGVERSECDDKPAIILTFRCLTGPIGQTIRNHIFLTENARPRLHLLVMRLLMPKNIPLSWEVLVGQHVVIAVEDDQYTNIDGEIRKLRKVTFDGIWPVTHPEVLHVTKDIAAIVADAQLQARKTPPNERDVPHDT